MKRGISQSARAGVGFGITSGVITTLGLIVGLDISTGSRLAVIGGIITIAVADAFSDALGMHISRESDKNVSQRGVWESTFATFFAKFLVALTFVLPVISMPLQYAVLACVGIGVALLTGFSYYIAMRNGESPVSTIGEHLLIAVIVLAISALVGKAVNVVFGAAT
ncbi:MAG: hypothetical protein N3H30_02330 [Candidatus Micrarchaeota archaeon]|nr:hypothetical protein [Candidatus Micrarchaeota archaeon]